MFPSQQLIALEQRKAFLRERIALRRARAVIEARRVARPLHTVDALYQKWRQLSPLLKALGIPFALWSGRRLARRPGGRGLVGTALRWAPLVLAALRGFRSARP
jgi:hypothetical protein